MVTHRSDRPRLALALAIAVLLSFLIAPVAVAQDEGPPADEPVAEPACGTDDDDDDGADAPDDATVDGPEDEPDTAEPEPATEPETGEPPAGDGEAGSDDAQPRDDEPASDTRTDAEPDAGTDPDDGGEAPTGDTPTETDPEDCPPPQISLADLVSPAPAAVDLELQAALGTIGFLDTWYAVTSAQLRRTSSGSSCAAASVIWRASIPSR